MFEGGQMKENKLGIKFGNAICYSGYREDQSPQNRTFPSYEEICEDLSILDHNWQYLRLYDCSRHAELVLEAVSKEGFDFKVMLGVDMRAEQSNPGCPWGANYVEGRLETNRQANSDEIDLMIELANGFPEIVFSGFNWFKNERDCGGTYAIPHNMIKPLLLVLACCKAACPITL